MLINCTLLAENIRNRKKGVEKSNTSVCAWPSCSNFKYPYEAWYIINVK